LNIRQYDGRLNTIRGVTETGDGFGDGWFGNQPIKSVGVTEIRAISFSRKIDHFPKSFKLNLFFFCKITKVYKFKAHIVQNKRKKFKI